MATKLELLQEANRRGLLPPDKVALLGEFERRNPTQPVQQDMQEQPQELPQDDLQEQPQEESFQEANRRRLGQFAQGVPQGLGNLFVGGVQAATDLGEGAAKGIEKLVYGDTLDQETFGDRLASQVGIRKEEQSKLPTSERVGIFAGETAPLLGVGAGQGLIKGGAKAGAAISALSQQEEAGLGGRIKETAIGGATGLAAGGVLKGLGVGAKAIGGGAKKVFTATKPEDILARRLPADQTADLLNQLKTATPDSPVLLPDIAGDEVQGLTRAIGKLSGGKDIITDALENRSKDAVRRVTNQLAKDVSNVDSYFGSLDDLSNARSKMAAPLYKKAFDKGTTLDIKKNKALFDKIAPDIKDARAKFRMDENIADNSLTMLDAAKKSLDDKIGVAVRGGENQQASVLLGIKKDLVNKLDELNPDYKKARQVFSDFSSIKGAQEQGLQFSKMRPEEIRRYMSGLGVSEKEAFGIGVRENLQKTVTSTGDGADPAKRIFGNTFKRDQLKAIFQNDTKYNQFTKKMNEEIKAAETKFKVLGGSRTDINLASETEFLNKIAQTGGAVATGGKLPLINAAVSSIKNKFGGISEKNAKQLATILVNRKESIKLLESIVKKEQAPVQKRLINEFIKSIRPELLTTKALQDNDNE